jgi:flagellar biosynthetic protein FlhB
MADGSDLERTEEATPKRREEAREEGRIPKSQELTVAISLVGSAIVLRATGPALGRIMTDIMGSSLASLGSARELDAASAVSLLQHIGWQTVMAMGLTLAALAGVTLAINALQARGVTSWKALAPKWERMNPGENFKRMVGLQPWMELVKSLFKLVLVGAVVYSALRSSFSDMLALAQEGPTGFLEVVRLYSLKLLMTCGLAYLGLAALDYLYQYWSFEKNLRMTKEEVKQEAKQSEGDPMVKQRMRSIGRQRARQRMMQDVKKADLVLVNPTHIAIALRYDPDEAPAPIVLAMGERKVAERIKQLAFEHHVPVIQNKPLARALIKSARVGMMIPAELYLAVAEVLAFVFKQRAMYGKGWRGSAVA